MASHFSMTRLVVLADVVDAHDVLALIREGSLFGFFSSRVLDALDRVGHDAELPPVTQAKTMSPRASFSPGQGLLGC